MAATRLTYPKNRRRKVSSTNQRAALAAIGSLLLSFGTAYVLMIYQSLHVVFRREPSLDDAPPKIVGAVSSPSFVLFPDVKNTTISSSLPLWMKDYLAWHSKQLKSLNADNWRSDHKFLVARCLDLDRACGGISDRLKSLPTLMLLAAQSRRILFLQWSRPAPLQEFLVPTSAVNWSLPTFVPAKGLGTRRYTKLSALIEAVEQDDSTVPVLCARIQDPHGGSDYYNAHPWNRDHYPDRAFRRVFRSLFFTFFAPSTRVLEQYQREVQPLLHDGNKEYRAAHLRAHYGHSPIAESKVQAVAINAVNCASQLGGEEEAAQSGTVTRTTTPILFLSDSALAVQKVREHAAGQNLPVWTLPHREQREPLHLDKADSPTAADYLDTFVDLLLFANARCISHGQGGFGRLGVLLSRDPMCFRTYIDAGRYVECEWKD